jgi:hypothetical protein
MALRVLIDIGQANRAGRQHSPIRGESHDTAHALFHTNLADLCACDRIPQHDRIGESNARCQHLAIGRKTHRLKKATLFIQEMLCAQLLRGQIPDTDSPIIAAGAEELPIRSGGAEELPITAGTAGAVTMESA